MDCQGRDAVMADKARSLAVDALELALEVFRRMKANNLDSDLDG